VTLPVIRGVVKVVGADVGFDILVLIVVVVVVVTSGSGSD